MRPCAIAAPALFLLLSIGACQTAPKGGEPAQPAAPAVTAAAPVAASPAAKPAVHLGDPIAAPEVALADIAKDPSKFTGKPFTTHGTVTSVCQEMGCWMEIKDSATQAHLKMHGHSFFVPKTASGRPARIQATLVPSGEKAACGDPECAPKDLAMLQLDATGVELD